MRDSLTRDDGAQAPFWERSYAAGVTSHWPLPPPRPLEELLSFAAYQWPDAVAVDFYDRTITYGELLCHANRAAAGLQRVGVRPGMNVGLCLLNTPHYIICAFAILMAGGRAVNFSPLAASRELHEQVMDSDVEVMITNDREPLYTRVTALRSVGRLRVLVVCALDDFLTNDVANALVGGCCSGAGCADDEVAFSVLTANDGAYVKHARGPLDDEIAVIAYSGGTTGNPKGAVLTHANFSAMVSISCAWTGEAVVPAERRSLVVLPLCHIMGFASIMLLGVALGATLVLHLGFDVNRVLTDLQRKRITTFAGVPTMYSMLVGHSQIADANLEALTYCYVGGAPLPHDVLARFRKLTGITPQVGYGLTETTALATMQIVGAEPRVGTVGLPPPHTVIEIVDLETGSELMPVGIPGEICCRGPHVMKEYWRRPEETRIAMAGGRFHTGDIGVFDADGYLTLLDRKKDMIIVGGYKVFPAAVENVLYAHDAVEEAAVIGVPDSALGERVKAFITVRPGHAAPGYTELRSFLMGKLASYEIPSEIDIRSTLPKTAVGKVSRRDLQAQETASRTGITR